MTTRELSSIAAARELLSSGRARQLRQASHLSLRDVAQALDTSPATVLRWESGEQRPRAESALLYARLLRAVQAEVTRA